MAKSNNSIVLSCGTVNSNMLNIVKYISINGQITGYDLTKVLSVNGRSHQQIYRDLKTLQSFGVLTYEVEPQDGKPDRKLYSLANVPVAYKIMNFLDTEEKPASDFSKSDAADYYTRLSMLSSANGEDYAARYKKHMQLAETAFYESIMREQAQAKKEA